MSMSSTSRASSPGARPRLTRSLPSAMNAMKPTTYMSPYQRTASGPKETRTGSNCGWTSKKKSPGIGAGAPDYPRGSGCDATGAAEIAQVLPFRAHRRQVAVALEADHEADRPGHDERDREAGRNREHVEQDTIGCEARDEAGDAEGEQHEPDHEGGGFH